MNKSVQRMLDEEASWEKKLSKAKKDAEKSLRAAHKNGQQLVEQKLAEAKAHAAHHRDAVQKSTQEHVRDIEEEQQRRVDAIMSVDAQAIADRTQL